MKKILLILFLIIISISAYCSNGSALGLVYSFGIMNSSMTNGVVVGGGEYVLTTKSSIFEEMNQVVKSNVLKIYGHINPYPLFASNETGEIYECQTVAVMDDYDLALLKLPIKLKSYCYIEPKPAKIPTGKFENVPAGKKFTSTYISLSRKEDNFVIDEFISKEGILEKGSFDKRYYVTDEQKPKFNMGSPLFVNANLLGVYTALQPLLDVKKDKEYTGGEFALASQVLDYCKENNLEFHNLPTVFGNIINLDQLFIIDEIIGNMEFDSENILSACNKYKKDSSYINVIKGIAYENQGDIDNALKSYEKAISLKEKEPLAQIRYANLKGDKITRLKDLLKQYPNDYRIYERLCKCYLEQQNFEAAKSNINLAVKYNENDPILLLEKAKIESKQKNYNEVLNTISKLNTLCPRWEDSLIFQYYYFVSIGDTDNANRVQSFWDKIYDKPINQFNL